MKALMVCSVAVLFCSVIAIRSALAQEGQVCQGGFNGCTPMTCLTGGGTCPVSELPYSYYDLLSDSYSTCVSASNTCSFTEIRTVCTAHTYTTKGAMGCSNFVCNIPDYQVLACGL
jgi:hypothetical protein